MWFGWTRHRGSDSHPNNLRSDHRKTAEHSFFLKICHQMLAVRKEILTREKCRYVPITPLVVPSPGGGVSVDWYMATF